MSGVIHKVKEAVTSHGSSNQEHHHTGTGSANAYDSTKSSNHGPHGNNITDAADPRIDSDRSQMTGAAHNTRTTGTGANNAAGFAPGHSTHSAATGPTTTGTHNSNIANQVDPRIDSDRSTHHTTTGMTGTTGTGAHNTANPFGSAGGVPAGGVPHTSTHSATTGPTSTTAGPHTSNIANQVDPRINSDRSTHHTTPGMTGTTGTGAHNTTNPFGSARGVPAGAVHAGGVPHTSTHSATTGPTSTTAGPHKSNIANKADPRIGSEHGSHVRHGTTGPSGGVSTHSATTGPASSTAGPHRSNMVNEVDPRIDSDRSKERGNVAGPGRFDQDVHKSSIGGAGVMHGMGGSGGPTTTKTFEQAQHNDVAGSSYNSKKTVGPHQSDLANKVDPRVDSDLDGSKTIGSQRV